MVAKPRTRRRDPSALAVALSLLACSTSGESGTGLRPDGSGLFPSQLPPDFQCEPTLESIKSGIFETSCAWYTCHGVGDVAWGLHLIGETQALHDGLVNVTAASCPPWLLIAPGDPERSYLWNKITEREPACGDRMPWGVEPLPAVALDCIRGWIEQLEPVGDGG